MNANEYKSNTGKLLVAVMAMALIVVGCAVMFSDDVNAVVDEGDVASIGDEGYKSLDDAIAAAQKLYKDSGEEVEIKLLIDGEITGTTTVDLTGITINCQTNSITTSIGISGGTIVASTANGAANNVLKAEADNLTFSGITFELYVSENKECMPWAINSEKYNLTVSGCTFKAMDYSGLYGAIHMNAFPTESTVKLTVSNSVLGKGVITYKGATLLLENTGDVILNIPDTGSGSADTSRISKTGNTDITQTVVGWLKSTTGNAEYDSTDGNNINIDIDNEFNFGTISKADGMGADDNAHNITVTSGGNLTASGGEDLLIVVNDGGSIIAGEDGISADVNVAGTASGKFNGNVTVTSPDADTTEVTGTTVSTDIESYNALSSYSGEKISAADGSWTYDGTALYLDNYTGNYYFSGDFTSVVLNGENKITINADAINKVITSEGSQTFGALNSSEGFTISGDAGSSLTITVEMGSGITGVGQDGDRISAIYSAGKIDITVPSLTINVTGTVGATEKANQGVYGIYGATGIEIGKADKPVTLEMTVAENEKLAFGLYTVSGDITLTNVDGNILGGNRGIHVNGGNALKFDGCNLTITGSEKAVQANTTGSIVTITGDSYIVLELPVKAPAGYNGGVDDRYGIKAVSLKVDSGSMLVTDGMRLFGNSWNYVNNGIVVINGGYEQNDKDENTPALIAGLYVDSNASAGKVSVNVGIPSALADGVTYVENGAYVASQVNVIGTTTPGDVPVYGSVDAANEALQDPSITEIIIAAPASGTIDISGLDTNGKIVNVGGTATGEITVNKGTILVSSADGLIVGGVSFDSSSKVTVTYDTYGNAILTGTVTAIDLEKEETVTVNGTINGTVTGVGSGITFNNVSVTNAVLTGGSVEISGDYVIGKDGSIVDDSGSVIASNELVIAGNTTITGTGTINVENITVNPGVTLTIGAGVTIQLDGVATLFVSEKAVVTGEGTIELLNGNMGITNNGTIDVEVAPSGSATASDVVEFVNALPYYNEITVDGEISFTVDALDAAGINARTFTVDNEKKITVTSGGSFTVGKGVTLEFTGLSVVDGADDFDMTIENGGTLVIDNSDIFTTVDVHTGAVLTLRNCETTITGATTDVSDIGFGKTVTFSDGYTIGGTMNVYGSISVPAGQTLSVSRNAVIDVTATGAVDVAGTLNMNGTMTVDGAVDVAGTMNVTGTLAGVVDNYGTVVYNGTSNTATVKMYGGATLNVEKATGTLTVTGATDYKEADGEMPKSVYNAELTLTGVSGLNVVANESIVAATKEAGVKITMTLDISGSVTAGTIATELTGADSKTGSVTVENTLDVAKDVSFTFGAGKYTINGTVNFANGANVNNNGIITVVGEITTVGAAAVAINGTVNAAFYDVTTPAVAGVSAQSVTRTYTSLATAVGVTNADNSTIFISGKLTVAADETVEVPATLKVNYYSGIESSITVDGTLVFSDYETSCLDKVKHINADVMFDETPARTYTSLANAIGMGITDIVLNDNVTIYGNMTIPAGVTVSSDKYGITVSATDKDGKHNDVTLTVEGALELTAQDAGVELESYGTEGKSGYKEAALIVSGMGYVYLNTENTTSGSDYLSDLVSGAYYDINASESGANVVVDVIATVEKAAADSANVYSNTITIKGEVTAAGDLTFTAGEDKALTVKVDGPTDTAFVGQTVTLVGDVTFDATDSSSATVTDGANAVALNKATGVTVSIEPDTDSDVEDATIFVMNGTLVGKATVSAGTVYVDGTVSAASGSGADAVAAAVLDVANGATMVVGDDGLTVNGELSVEGTVQIPESVELTISVTGKAAIGGTVEVTGTMNMNGKTQIDGTVAPAEDAENAKIVVNSIVTVGSKPTEMGQTNAAILSGASYGEATSGVYIKAYNGATVEFADKDYKPVYTQLNIKGADSTGYYLYMTVYAVSTTTETGTTTGLFTDVIYKESFSLNGYDTGLYFNAGNDQNSGLYKYGNWYTSSDRVANTALTTYEQNVGFNENAAIYAQVALVKVAGVVSEGTGLNLYIDGVPASTMIGMGGTIELSIGTHDVAFDVSAQYDGSNAVITLNGEAVTDGKITITSDMSGFVLAVSGATPAGTGEIVVNTGSGDLSLTDILLIILVVLIVIMAIIVALRLMRS